MRLIDADKLKSIYSKEKNIEQNKVISILDKMPEEEEGKYQRMYEQARFERDMLEDQLDKSISTYFLEKWLGKNLFEKLLHDYQHRPFPCIANEDKGETK